MAGYLGSKAVLLSTTAASVTGNADIGGDLTVDTNTLYVDSTNNRVGVGTSSPATALDVTGTVTADGLTVDGVIQTVGGGSAGAVAIGVGDTDSGLFRSAFNEVRISAGGKNVAGFFNSADVAFYEDTGTTPKFFWDASAEGLNIGATSVPLGKLDISDVGGSGAATIFDAGANGDNYFTAGTSGIQVFRTGGTERMRLNAGGELLIGTTSTAIASSSTDTGTVVDSSGVVIVARSGAPALYLNRQGSDGHALELRKNGTKFGEIGVVYSDDIYIGSNLGNTGIAIGTRVLPTYREGLTKDNLVDLGAPTARWDDVYATNGTIQTSDENEKQQIASLTDAEMTAAKAISKLFRTFKWNDSVAEKGDAARTHTGVIAQEVEQAMTDAGLDAGKYAFFISTTWWETQTEVPAVEAVEAQDAVYEDVIIPAVEEVLDEEGNVVTEAQPERTEQRLVSEAVEAVEAREAYTRTDTYDTLEEAPEGAVERNRKGIRYPQLLSFIGAATEQRLASIEARLDALEAN